MPRDEREVTFQIHVSLDTGVEIPRHQKRVARGSDKGIEYLRWGNNWQEEQSLDINIWRLDHILLNRKVCAKSVDDSSSRVSLPQVTRDTTTPSLKSKIEI